MYCFMAIPDALLPVNPQYSSGSEAPQGGTCSVVDRTEGVVEIEATVDGLDRHTCWVRWDENRRALEGGRGYAVRRLTADQIAAAKLYQRVLWTREREMNGPPRPSRPRLTILVDQDIED